LTQLARIPDWVFLVAFCVVFSLQTLSSVAQKSATFDEPSDLVSGYLELTRGQYWLKPETLPLVKLVAAAPLLLLHVRTPPLDDNRWKLYDRTLYEFNDGDNLLMVARAAVLPFSLLLGCLVFVWARRLFGRGAALFALLLYAFEPNLIAHSALVTTDLAVACLFFLTVYALFRLVEGVSISRILLMALASGLAVVTKLSMLLLVPLIGLLGLIVSVSPLAIPVTFPGGRTYTLVSRGRKLVAFVLIFLVSSAVAYVVIWAIYRFDYSAAPSLARQPDCPLLLPGGTISSGALDWLRHTRAFPEPYLYNFIQHLHVARFIPGFLLGEIRQGGWWYYFVVTLLVKTPFPLLILMGLALTVYARQWRRVPLVSVFLVIPAAIYFGFISASGINIGHRHLLPILPLLITLTGVLISWAAVRGAWAKAGLAILAFWYLVSSLAVFPHYLAYFNKIVGGPANGSRYLADSNLDWGQDLTELRRYMERHGIDRVWLSYFGTASPDYHRVRYDRLPGSTFVGHEPVRAELLALERLPHLRGTVAISVTNLRGVWLPCFGMSPRYFEGYRDVRPIARIGYSIYLYRFE
jgi:4-amino-4-deoxy-L-arabinose transferase-like glycosyltransferase